MKEYIFNVKRYVRFAGYKYLLGWLGAMFVGGVLLRMQVVDYEALAFAMVFCSFFVILIFGGRIATWKRRKVVLHPSRLVYVCSIESGADYGGYGERERKKTFNVFQLDRMKLQGKTLVATGDILCNEYKFSCNIPSRMEYQVKQVKIPPYFENWADLINQINDITGGCLK